MRRTVAFVLIVLVPGIASIRAAQGGRSTAPASRAMITSPLDLDQVPGPDKDPTCDYSPACSAYVRVDGMVPKGLWPFLAIAPLLNPSNLAIQSSPPVNPVTGIFHGELKLPVGPPDVIGHGSRSMSSRARTRTDFSPTR